MSGINAATMVEIDRNFLIASHLLGVEDHATTRVEANEGSCIIAQGVGNIKGGLIIMAYSRAGRRRPTRWSAARRAKAAIVRVGGEELAVANAPPPTR